MAASVNDASVARLLNLNSDDYKAYIDLIRAHFVERHGVDGIENSIDEKIIHGKYKHN